MLTMVLTIVYNARAERLWKSVKVKVYFRKLFICMKTITKIFLLLEIIEIGVCENVLNQQEQHFTI